MSLRKHLLHNSRIGIGKTKMGKNPKNKESETFSELIIPVFSLLALA